VGEDSIYKPRVGHSVDQFSGSDPLFVTLFGRSSLIRRQIEGRNRGRLLHIEIEICEPVIISTYLLRTNRCVVPAKGSTCAKAHS
jgi:hypothetical protein